MRWAAAIACGLLLVLMVISGGTQSQVAAQATPLPRAYLPLVLKNTGGPTISGCPLFPADNILNRRVDALPVHTKSHDWINSISSTKGLHPDFGANWSGGPFGIPYIPVPGSQPKVMVSFYWPDESDPGPYPIPPNAPVEGNGIGDSHVLVLDSDNCKLYEMFDAHKNANNTWNAGSGAVFDLRSNTLRPSGWTSADAAGLSILAGLVRYDEVQSGTIRHAIRFTTQTTSEKFIWPARHEAGDPDYPNAPPMGARFRLKASKNISGYDPSIQVIFKAFKEYGLILADNGSNWYISGVPDPRWNDDMLVNAFNQLKGSDFEAVDVSSLMIDPNSGQSK